ncbi:MAG TPA: hypothetical protein VKD69_18015 [Vicinamibacterales bacterium]|nr:hypothetical protein [Vicinamibacterales bacterium]
MEDGNTSAIAESPTREGLIFVGTDDGLVQTSEDGGAHWRKIDRLPGVPADAYIARIRASQHDAATVYLAAENHQNGDFKPYLLKSADTGRTWTSISGDLPARGSTYAIAEDPVDPNLLFAGTEFAAYWSRDGGQHWLKIAGVPTIAVREIAIQKRENDLVLGTFGGGVYIVDDYSPIRGASPAALEKAATLFSVRSAVLFVPTQQYAMPGKGFQGEMFFQGDNPPYGATFTYYLKDAIKTLKEKRIEAEQAAEKAGRPIQYPTPDALRAEASEEAPTLLLTVSSSAGVAAHRNRSPHACTSRSRITPCAARVSDSGARRAWQARSTRAPRWRAAPEERPRR